MTTKENETGGMRMGPAASVSMITVSEGSGDALLLLPDPNRFSPFCSLYEPVLLRLPGSVFSPSFREQTYPEPFGMNEHLMFVWCLF